MRVLLLRKCLISQKLLFSSQKNRCQRISETLFFPDKSCRNLPRTRGCYVAVKLVLCSNLVSLFIFSVTLKPAVFGSSRASSNIPHSQIFTPSIP